MKNTLSPKELAEVVGLSESSIKRWADYGQIQVTRTTGGHRRILLSEAIRYIRQSGLPIANAQALGLRDLDGLETHALGAEGSIDQPLIEAIVAGDADRAKGLILWGYVSGRSVSELCDGPITRAMHQVGELWQHNPDGIAIEHRANEVVQQSLHELRSIFPTPAADAPVATGGAPAGDPYVLPSLMSATVLASEGWRDRNLGVDLPLDSIARSAIGHQASLVWLSVSVDGLAEKLATELASFKAQLKAAGIALAIGGRALVGRRQDTLRDVITLSSMSELTAHARQLKPPTQTAPSTARRETLETAGSR